MTNFSKILAKLSNYFSKRKGLLLFLAILLVFLNFLLGLFFNNWLTQSNLILHIGVITGFLGVMIAWAL
jgi:hypothetical protein